MYAQSLFLRKKNVCWWKTSTRSYKNLIDSARKQNRKEVLANYNKTRISIGHQQDLLMELKEVLRVQAHAEVPLRM